MVVAPEVPVESKGFSRFVWDGIETKKIQKPYFGIIINPNPEKEYQDSGCDLEKTDLTGGVVVVGVGVGVGAVVNVAVRVVVGVVVSVVVAVVVFDVV